MTKRGKLLAAIGLCLLGAPLEALAQAHGKVWRIGILTPTQANLSMSDAFRRGMHDLGYLESENYVVERRSADGDYERLPGLAAELVRQKVDILVTNSTAATQAARNATTTIPIVMLMVSDPIASGIVTSLAQPGGNVTGISSHTSDLGPKYVGLLMDVLPKLSRLAVLVNFANPSHAQALNSTVASARSAGLKVLPVAARAPEEIDLAFAEMSRAEVGAVIVMPDNFFFQQREQIAALAIKERLPSITSFRVYAESGGLMSYGNNAINQYPRAATYVARVLKGARPADLPVEQDANLELVINLKTAKALGLTFPQSVLLRANEVIQ